jgi:hypothetical protein
VIAVGTGQAMRIAKKGEADLLFVHDPFREDKFVAEGYGVTANRSSSPIRRKERSFNPISLRRIMK